MSKELAIGHFLTLFPKTASNGTLRFQNFYINQNVSDNGEDFSFLPFGFSGISINRAGDNVDASLVFPNTGLSRPWSVVSIRNAWVARVQTMLLNPNDQAATKQQLYDYTGQISEGGWDNTTVTVTLNSVLNAVSANVPHRVLDQSLVGFIPTTTRVNV